MVAATAVVALVLGTLAESAAARALHCGVPITAELGPGGRGDYDLLGFDSAVVVVDVADVSGTIDLLNLASGGDSTCSGSVVLTPDQRRLEVSDCIGQDQGRYTITASIVSQGPGNCSQTLPCGRFPHVRQLTRPGQVDAYSFPAERGDRVNFRAYEVRGSTGGMRVRLFDPDGRLVSGDSCSGMLNMALEKGGVYTALVSACGVPAAGLYLLAFSSPACPAGPEVTHLGLARADGTPLGPDFFDEKGRPVFVREFGAGFVVVIESRAGSSGAAVGNLAYDYDEADPNVLPDLQVLLSRPLGDGSSMVCDKTVPSAGGVPATPALEYLATPAVAAAINDFGCRFDNGAGVPTGVGPADACTSFPSGDFGFVEGSSELQFCMVVSQAWAFPRGQTIVKVRARDAARNLGWPREMVVQVGSNNAIPCPGDCNGDEEVTVDEVVAGVRMGIGELAVWTCNRMDQNEDGEITVDELLLAVNAALGGCVQEALISTDVSQRPQK